MKTLFVSDLDGTLLHSDARISENTIRVINDLTAKGMLFSYIPSLSTTGMKKFTDSRAGDVRERSVLSVDNLREGDVFL